MSPPALDLPLALFASGTLLATITALYAISSAAARRARGRERARARNFRVRMRAFLAGRLPARQLRQAAAHLGGDLFWATLERFAPRRRRSARRALASALERTHHLGAEVRALRDDSSWRCELAVRRVGLLPGRTSRRALRRAMTRGPEHVTLAAARALATARDGAALRWLLAHPEALRRRGHRVWTGLWLRFGRPGAPALTTALAEAPRHVTIERALVDALGQLSHAPATPAIAARLTHADAEIRLAAARALGSLGATGASPALIEALDDRAWPVRAQAARSLGILGADAAIPWLVARLEDRAYWVRRHSAYALVSLGPVARAALARAAAASPDPYAREVAAEALSGDAARPRARDA